MRRNVFLYTFGNIFYNACTWLITIMVVHLASFEQAGYLSLAMSVSSTCSTIALFNMRSFQITDAKHEFSTAEYVMSRIATSLFAVAVCVVASFVGNDPYQALCINLYMLIKLVEAITDVFHGVDQLHDRFDIITVSCILRGLGFVVCFALGLKLTGKLAIAILFIALSHIAVCVFYDIRKALKIEPISGMKWTGHILELLKKCVPLVLFSFALSLINTVAKKVLGHTFGTEDLGIYSSIASPTLIVQVFATVVFSPFLPRLSELNASNNKAGLRKMINYTYLAFAGLAIVVCIGAVLLGRWGLSFLLGKEILEYYSLFMPVVWVTILYSVAFVLSQIMVSFRKMKEILIGMVVAVAVFFAVVTPSMNIWGLNGASVSQMIAFLVFIPYMVFVCERHMRKELA